MPPAPAARREGRGRLPASRRGRTAWPRGPARRTGAGGPPGGGSRRDRAARGRQRPPDEGECDERADRRRSRRRSSATPPCPSSTRASWSTRSTSSARSRRCTRRSPRTRTGSSTSSPGARWPRALGYDPGLLDRIPAEAVESFAGVGHYLDLAGLAEGECVVDLGSGSGTDLFCAAVLVGPAGRAIGIDMTPAQLAKAGRLRDAHGFSQVELVEARIEEVPLEDGIADCVVSNGVINLAPDKGRVLRRGGPPAASPGAGSRSPTSSAGGRWSSARAARLTCGPRASAAPSRATATSRRSRPPACGWRRCARTHTSSSPSGPWRPAPSTASSASRCWPGGRIRRAVLLVAALLAACAAAPAALAAPEAILPPGLTVAIQDDHLAVDPRGRHRGAARPAGLDRRACDPR